MKTKLQSPLRIQSIAASLVFAYSVPLASGATISASDGDGNLTISTSGADSYIADGHAIINPPYSVTVDKNAVVSGESTTILTVASNGYTISNEGALISNEAGSHGIILDDGITVKLLENIGHIGANTAIFSGPGATITDLVNHGDIIGTAFNGIVTGNDSMIRNLSGGSILGNIVAVSSGDETVILNSGSIGGGDYGIHAGNNLHVNNFGDGLIGASSGGTAIHADGGDNVVVNFGAIVADNGTAIRTGSGNDTIILSGENVPLGLEPTINGGLVVGDVNGGAGDNDIEFLGYSTMLGDVIGFQSGVRGEQGRSHVKGNVNIQDFSITDGIFSLVGDLNGEKLYIGSTNHDPEMEGSGNWNVNEITVDKGGVLSVASVDLSLAINTDLLRFRPESFYTTMVTPNSTVGTLDVNGPLVIEAGSELQLRPLTLLAPIQDATRVVIENNGPLHATNFDSAAFRINGERFESSSVSLTPINNNGNIFVEIQHDYTAVPGLSENGIQIGAYLNSVLPFAMDPDLAAFLGYVDYSEAGIAAQAIHSLDQSLNVFASDLTIHSGQTLNRVVENHTAMLRGRSAKSHGTSNTYWNAWIAGGIESLELEGGLRDLDGDSNQVTVGVDYAISGDLVVGLFAQMARTDVNAGHSSADVDSVYFGAYGTYGRKHGLFIDALLAYGNHDLETKHALPVFGDMNASYGSGGWSALLGGGYMMEASNFSWGPTAALEYQNLDVDGYTNGSLFNVRGRNTESLRSLLGVKFQSPFVVGSAQAEFHASARWAHQFMADSDRSSTASMNGLPGSFTTTAADRSENSFLLNLGVSVEVTESISVMMGYFGEKSFNGSGTTSHGGVLQANFAF